MSPQPYSNKAADHNGSREQLILELEELREQISRLKENERRSIRAEVAQKDALKWFEAIFENTPLVAVQGFDRNGVVTHWNKASKKLYGFSAKEAIGRRLQDIILPNNAVEEFEKKVEMIWQTGRPLPCKEWEVMARNGEKRWVIATMFPILEHGSVAEAYCMDVDITDRLMAEEELRRAHDGLELRVQQRTAELEAINESMRNEIAERQRAEDALRESEAVLALAQKIAHVGNWEQGVKTCDLKWSREVYNIFGVNPEKFTPSYESVRRLIHPEDERHIRLYIDAITNNDTPQTVDFRIIRPDGSTRNVHVEAEKSTMDDSGGLAKVFGIIQDITEYKHAERALEDAKMQAELYLDLMGHDINNMNQIGIGFLELALDTLSLDEYGSSLLSKSLSAFESSSRLIDNVRKLQKIRSGQLQQKEMDVGQVLADIQCHYMNLHGSSITINYEPASDCMVMADEMLYDLFSNLVGNAIKHSTGTPIINMVIETTKENGNKYYRVAIEDNGPGISDEFKVIIFNRHLRNSAKAKGSGIGLYLVKALADNYKGRVWVEDRVPFNRSNRSKGSRFMVMLPASGEK